MMRLTLIGLFLLLARISAAQDSAAVKRFELRGYVKDMQILNYDRGFKTLITSNLIHNRLNMRWKIDEHWKAGVELRNRLYWGEQVSMTPNFADNLRNKNEAFNMSITWINSTSLVLHTNIDRLWLEYATQKWNARIGRQRINWGIASTWNPNDLFNTFNFIDFDYEERPGSDAVKFQYLTGPMSNLEVTGALTEEGNLRGISAARYFMNWKNYDIQFIGGWYINQPTFGLGWSGSIGQTGFKGEFQQFVNHGNVGAQTNLVLEADRTFKGGWYMDTGMLYNSSGIDQPVPDWSTINLQFSPKNLMPTKWNVLYTATKQITPLLTAGSGFVYAPQAKLLIILPQVGYELTTDLDINLVWQSFFAQQTDAFAGLSHRIYFRLKYSF
ncbi:MAG: hypothetical protein JST46_11930 [Bacteroidetes bacterium]|nr:hypothetical protein [Bacteroidota bacterium]